MFGAVATRTNEGISQRSRFLVEKSVLDMTIRDLKAALTTAERTVAAQAREIADLRSRLNDPTEIARRALVESLSGAEISAGQIIAEVSKIHDVPVSLIRGPRGSRRIIAARHHAIYEVRRRCDWLSQPEIGRIFGGRDHTTIIHAVREWPKKAAALGIPCEPMEAR